MNKKRLISLIMSLAFAASLLVAVFNIVGNLTKKENTKGDFQVEISIECTTVLDNYSALDSSLKNTKYIPEDGIILNLTKTYAFENESVLDVLKRVTRENNIQLEYTQSPNDSYVEGINYLYEFSCGELSGWMYKVNGRFASMGCDAYKLSPNDKIEWVYTCNLGEDVGDKF